MFPQVIGIWCTESTLITCQALVICKVHYITSHFQFHHSSLVDCLKMWARSHAIIQTIQWACFTKVKQEAQIVMWWCSASTCVHRARTLNQGKGPNWQSGRQSNHRKWTASQKFWNFCWRTWDTTCVGTNSRNLQRWSTGGENYMQKGSAWQSSLKQWEKANFNQTERQHRRNLHEMAVVEYIIFCNMGFPEQADTILNYAEWKLEWNKK